MSETAYQTPAIPVSCGALLRDEQGRILILKPTYKSGWTIPGGVMEADGESPWDACRREVREETGIEVTRGRLAVVDTRPSSSGFGLRYLFDCGALPEATLAGITVQRSEISQFKLADPDESLGLLRKAISRRVAAALASDVCRYLEDGRPVDGVS